MNLTGGAAALGPRSRLRRAVASHCWRRLAGLIAATAALAGCATFPPPRGSAARPLTIVALDMPNAPASTGRRCEAGPVAERARLARLLADFDADVISFRDLASAEDAQAIFDRRRYVIMLDRNPDSSADLCLQGEPGHGRNGLAIRRGLSFQLPRRFEDQRSGDPNGHASMEVALGFGHHPRLKLLALDLPAACAHRSQPACAQLPGVERWIEAAQSLQYPFLLLGRWNAGLRLSEGLAAPAPAEPSGVAEGAMARTSISACDSRPQRGFSRMLADSRALSRLRGYRVVDVSDGTGARVCLTIVRVVL